MALLTAVNLRYFGVNILFFNKKDLANDFEVSSFAAFFNGPKVFIPLFSR